jgi:hypothetical protein
MSLTNFKAQVSTLIEIELEEWRDGKKEWNVSNQFDESVLESALDSLDGGIDKAFDLYGNSNYKIMDIAHFLSSFKAPELDGCWVN